MPARKLGLPAVVPEDLAQGLATIRAAAEVPDGFPQEVEAAAERAAAQPRLPDLDRTDLELITIDPAGSRDLDQALHIARSPSGGFVVSYAIADVAAFVRPGDPIDVEAHRRGTTLYAPDRRTPLHPPVLSEGAASLLPNEVRPALLWTITLDHRGQTVAAEAARALVRSRAQLRRGPGRDGRKLATGDVGPVEAGRPVAPDPGTRSGRCESANSAAGDPEAG